MSQTERDQLTRSFLGMLRHPFLDPFGKRIARRKQTEPKSDSRRASARRNRIAYGIETRRRHKEIQKRIKMMIGRLSFLEHCIRSEKGCS
ncbi:hypothetical protein TNCV_2596321 [Trichonephila clavipes]|nr:hypothetical protein TNCV_2596321 [Trichonephila clavipes]